MNTLNDLDVSQRDFARGLRTRLRTEQPIDAAALARLGDARRQAVAAVHQPSRVWRHGLDGLAIASVLVVLTLIAPPSHWLHGGAPASPETVEAAAEDLAPEFADDLELLQWLDHEQDSRV
jgi:hypothetical protein